MTPEEFLKTDEINIRVVHNSKSKYIHLDDVLMLMENYKGRLLQLKKLYTETDMDNAYDKGFTDGNQRDLSTNKRECKHRWVHNVHRKLKYCSLNCDGFKAHKVGSDL
jgi:hypothetical protein